MITNKDWKYIFNALLLVFGQLFLFDHMSIWPDKGLIPYAYLLFILLLPYETNRTVLTLIGFFTGLAVDLIHGTIGINSAATLVVAYYRPVILRIVQPRHGYEANTTLSFFSYKLPWTLAYFIMSTTVHQTVLYVLSDFNFSLNVVLKIVLGSIYTTALMLLLHLLLFKNKTSHGA